MAAGDHTHDPPDHLAVELEFLYFLLTKGWIEHHEACATEAVSFASTTMLPWVNALRERLRSREPSGFYAWLISLIIAVLQYIGKSASISA